MATGLLAAGPASAASFNCFEWVRVSTARLIHPHHPHHALGVPHRHLAHAHVVPHIHRIASPLVRRPIACPEHEAVLASPIPGAPPHETLAMLESTLAGPVAAAPAATDVAQDTAAAVPAPEEVPAPPGPPIEFPFGPPGVVESPPDEFFPGPLPLTGFPVTPPLTPPDVFPPVTPPDTPPIVLPPGTPPVIPVTLPVTPPDIFPPGLPPGPPIVQGPGPGPGGVPEPGVWSLMLLGFGGVGATIRRRRFSVGRP